MKNKKLLLIGLLSLIFALTYSCNKSKTEDILNTPEVVKNSDAELLKLYNFSNTPVNGKITFEAKASFLSQFPGTNFNFLGRFHTLSSMNQGSTSLNGVFMKINNVSIAPNGVLDYRKSYSLPNAITGANNQISIQEETNSPVLNSIFRIPKLVEFEKLAVYLFKPEFLSKKSR